MKGFHLLISDAKSFFANEINSLSVWVLVLALGSAAFTHIEINSLKAEQKKNNQQLSEEINNVRKRVDFRYFNTTRTLENLYGVNIDTQDGSLKSEIILHKAGIQSKF